MFTSFSHFELGLDHLARYLQHAGHLVKRDDVKATKHLTDAQHFHAVFNGFQVPHVCERNCILAPELMCLLPHTFARSSEAIKSLHYHVFTEVFRQGIWACKLYMTAPRIETIVKNSSYS